MGMSTKINFDVGVIAELDVTQFKNILVIAGTQKALEAFEKKVKPHIKKPFRIFENVPVNLTDYVVYNAYNYANDEKVDCIISVGGEAALDCGKIVAMLLSQGGYLHDYLPGGKIGPHGIMPGRVHHITVPAMPAAGYEISNTACFVINGEKKTISSPHIIPDVTYIDPHVMDEMPLDLWASRGVDCFVTALMAYVSKNANAMSDAYAEKAIESYLKAWQKLSKKPGDHELIKHAAVASMNAFLASNFAGRGAVHAVADVLAGRFGFRYGIALALVAPEVCKFVQDANPKKFKSVGDISKIIKNAGVGAVSLKGKLNEEEIEKIASMCLANEAIHNPKRMELVDVKEILRRLP